MLAYQSPSAARAGGAATATAATMIVPIPSAVRASAIAILSLWPAASTSEHLSAARQCPSIKLQQAEGGRHVAHAAALGRHRADPLRGAPHRDRDGREPRHP